MGGISVLMGAARAALYINLYMFASCAAQTSAKTLFCSLLLYSATSLQYMKLSLRTAFTVTWTGQKHLFLKNK